MLRLAGPASAPAPRGTGSRAVASLTESSHATHDSFGARGCRTCGLPRLRIRERPDDQQDGRCVDLLALPGVWGDLERPSPGDLEPFPLRALTRATDEARAGRDVAVSPVIGTQLPSTMHQHAAAEPRPATK